MIPLICLCFALSTGHEPAISMTATPVQTPVAFHGHDLIAVGPAEQQAYAAGAPREDGWQHLLASFVATSIAGSVARAAGLSPHVSVYVGAALGARPRRLGLHELHAA